MTNQKPEDQTSAAIIVSIADKAEAWTSPDDTPYITVKVTKHEENYRLRSKAARDWLSFEYYKQSMMNNSGPQPGRVPGADVISDALNIIEARCKYEGGAYEIYQRVASDGSKIYVDMGTSDWCYIEIGPDGWKVLPSPCPVKFVRSKNMLALPNPVKGGSWMDLRAIINATDDQNWKLVVGWLMQGFWPRGPYNFLVIDGEQGSAKSMMAYILKMLVDPTTAGVRRPPTEEKDLMIAAQNERVLAFGNLSGLSSEMSDAFCCLSTGASLGARLLYTNEEESLMSAKRPCILEGIDSIATKGDLLDRSSIVHLLNIPDEMREEETVIRSKFEKIRGSMLWLILDATSHGLAYMKTINMPLKPRMADFAIWVTACEMGKGLPWAEGEFYKCYMESRKTAIRDMFETDVFAQAVFDLVKERKGTLTITAAKLLILLNDRAGIDKGREPPGWPKAPNKMKGRLSRIAPQLRSVDCEWKTEVVGNANVYTISIKGVK